MSDKPEYETLPPAPTKDALEKALAIIAAFPDAVQTFALAQDYEMSSMLDEILVMRVGSAAMLFRLRNDPEHLNVIRNTVINGESLRDKIKNRRAAK